MAVIIFGPSPRRLQLFYEDQLAFTVAGTVVDEVYGVLPAVRLVLVSAQVGQPGHPAWGEQDEIPQPIALDEDDGPTFFALAPDPVRASLPGDEDLPQFIPPPPIDDDLFTWFAPRPVAIWAQPLASDESIGPPLSGVEEELLYPPIVGLPYRVTLQPFTSDESWTQPTSAIDDDLYVSSLLFAIPFRAWSQPPADDQTISIVPPSLRVQAVSAGFYRGIYYNVGDVFDVLAADFSDSTVDQAPGTADSPVYGWMKQVLPTYPLFVYSLAADGLSTMRVSVRRVVL